MSTQVGQVYPIISGKSGAPLDNGLIYIGEAGQNAEIYPIQIYYDEDFTIPAPQPLRTINGYFSRNGSPAKIFIKAVECSIIVKDKFKILQWLDLNYSGILSGKGINASDIIDESGLTQQDINNAIKSEGLNILNIYNDVDDLGLAIEMAFAQVMATDCRKITIPDGLFVSKTTADITLSSDFTIEFGGGTTVNVDNRIDVLNVTQGDFTLNILGNGVSVIPNWLGGINDVSFAKLDSQTLGKSTYFNNVNVYESAGVKFNHGINAVGLNYSTISDCIFQAIDPIVNASVTLGTTTHAMGTEVINCKLHADNTAVTLINNGELGCEGWKFKGGEYFGKTGLKTVDNLNNPAYFPPLLLLSGVHINAQRFLSLSGISRVKVSACDLQSQVVSGSEFDGLIEFDGIQAFDIDTASFAH
jgi:hypothetical protein